MNQATFKQVADKAFSNADLPSYFSESMEPLCGCGVAGFEKATVTVDVAAGFLRGQCKLLNGEIDQTELTKMADIFRRKVYVV